MSPRILIIQTSKEKKNESDRFIGGDEWTNVWRLDEKSKIALKKESKDIYYCDFDKLDKIGIEGNEDAILWIRGQKNLEEVLEPFKNIVYKFTDKSYNIYFKYHEHNLIDEKIGQEKMVKFSEYGLTSENQFKRILKIDDDGKKYLDKMAPFEDIFTCFFLNPPDVLALVIHKVNGILSTLDLDIQTLLDCNFRKDIWDDIQNTYQNKKIIDDVKNWIDKNGCSLKRMVEQEKNENKYIEKGFNAISSLIEETDSIKPLKNILSIFEINQSECETDQMDMIRDNIEGFRNWYKELLAAFEEFIEIMKEENEK